MTTRLNGHPVLHTDLGDAKSVVHVHTRVEHLDSHDLAGLLLIACLPVLWGALILFGTLDAPIAVGVALWGAMVFCLLAATAVVVRGHRRRTSRRRARRGGQP